MKFLDYYLGKRNALGKRELMPINIFVWIVTAIVLGVMLNWIF